MKVVIVKPRNFVAKDLRTPKYRMKVAKSKKQYKRISTFKYIKEHYE
jgi:hypothetical protein